MSCFEIDQYVSRYIYGQLSNEPVQADRRYDGPLLGSLVWGHYPLQDGVGLFADIRDPRS